MAAPAVPAASAEGEPGIAAAGAGQGGGGAPGPPGEAGHAVSGQPAPRPALPLPLLDRVLCFTTLREFPRLLRVSKAVNELAAKPHVVCAVFRNSFHPCAALLKALELYPRFDLALAQCFCKWYLPLPRYVLQWLRQDRHGTPPPASDTDSSLSSPTAGMCRVPKDAYMYLMTQGYCRYVRPEMNSFLVDDDDVDHYIALLSDLVEEPDRNAQREILDELWELVVSCQLPVTLLPQRMGPPEEAASLLHILWERSMALRSDAFTALARAGFEFARFSDPDRLRSSDPWTRAVADDVFVHRNDPDRMHALRRTGLPFLGVLSYFGIRVARSLVIKLLALALRMDERDAVIGLVRYARHTRAVPPEQPSAFVRSAVQQVQTLTPRHGTILAYIADHHLPVYDVATIVVNEWLYQAGEQNARLVEDIARAVEIAHPDAPRIWGLCNSQAQLTREEVLELRVAAQAEGWDQEKMDREVERYRTSRAQETFHGYTTHRIQARCAAVDRWDTMERLALASGSLGTEALQMLVQRTVKAKERYRDVWVSLLEEQLQPIVASAARELVGRQAPQFAEADDHDVLRYLLVRTGLRVD
ncbi:hypothetical protein DFJ74DRAFT_765584 [Hyaloraphidium curvatum]|nr:hypothetical protein DFJ74DRAFT_765584 [Hyaloraphidium curvatum]